MVGPMNTAAADGIGVAGALALGGITTELVLMKWVAHVLLSSKKSQYIGRSGLSYQ